MAAVDELKYESEAPPRRSWFVRLLWIGSLLLVVAALILVVRWRVLEHGAKTNLNAIIAELDETDPYWRLEDIEDRRRIIPDAENSALVITQIEAGLHANPPKVRPEFPMPMDRAVETPPDEELDPHICAQLRAELKHSAPELRLALSLSTMKDGRFPFSIASDGISTRINSQAVREVVRLLRTEMFVRLRDGDIEGACVAARAMFTAVRSVGDEPTIVSSLIRIACSGIAVGSLERILAQGEPSHATLAELQKMLEDEEAFPNLRIALRGERGIMHLLMNAVEDGKLSASGLTGQGGNATQSSNPLEKIWEPVYSRSAARAAHPELLRRLTEYIEIVDLPTQDRDEQMRIKEQELKSEKVPHFVRLLLPACVKVTEADTRVRAFLRVAIVALAAERFRQANKRWPKDLDELTPTYFRTVPLDPYDGKPLRMRATQDGLVIYALGSDLKDKGGKWDRSLGYRPGDNIVFQLWNVSERRKPAKNPDVGPPLLTPEELQNLMNPEWLPPLEGPAGDR